MSGRDPFGVMCDMWGLERAKQKAKEFGIPVSQEAIEEQERRIKETQEAWNQIFKPAITEDDGK